MINPICTKSREGLLLCISGPSGVGKGTAIERLMEDDPELWLSVSMTTRSPRPGEVDGVSYYFTSREEFERMLAAGEILEHDEFCGNYYGTPLKPIRDRIADGRDVLLDVTVAGALAIQRQIPSAVCVFLLPPDMPTLYKRLKDRATETEEQLAKRLQKAKEEINQAPRFDYIVVNERIRATADSLEAIMEAERCRSNKQLLKVKELIQSHNLPIIK